MVCGNPQAIGAMDPPIIRERVCTVTGRLCVPLDAARPILSMAYSMSGHVWETRQLCKSVAARETSRENLPSILDENAELAASEQRLRT